MAKRIKIAGYSRTCNNKEYLLEHQKEKIKDYVETFFPESELDFYEDIDRSGITFENRPGYQTMRPKLLSGEYDVFIVDKFSTISRRLSVLDDELDKLEKAGVRVVVIDYNIDTNNNKKISEN